MSTFAQLQQNRRIIQDFTSTALAGISNPFGRLAYVASLKQTSNQYQHAELAAVYGNEEVQQALAQCHQELFERVLESPWAVQEEDLHAYLGAMPNGLPTAAADWRKRESYRDLLPNESPDYLRELFCSNMRMMLDIIMRERSLGGLSPGTPRR